MVWGQDLLSIPDQKILQNLEKGVYDNITVLNDRKTENIQMAQRIIHIYSTENLSTVKKVVDFYINAMFSDEQKSGDRFKNLEIITQKGALIPFLNFIGADNLESYDCKKLKEDSTEYRDAILTISNENPLSGEQLKIIEDLNEKKDKKFALYCLKKNVFFSKIEKSQQNLKELKLNFKVFKRALITQRISVRFNRLKSALDSEGKNTKNIKEEFAQFSKSVSDVINNKLNKNSYESIILGYVTDSNSKVDDIFKKKTGERPTLTQQEMQDVTEYSKKSGENIFSLTSELKKRLYERKQENLIREITNKYKKFLDKPLTRIHEKDFYNDPRDEVLKVYGNRIVPVELIGLLLKSFDSGDSSTKQKGEQEEVKRIDSWKNVLNHIDSWKYAILEGQSAKEEEKPFHRLLLITAKMNFYRSLLSNKDLGDKNFINKLKRHLINDCDYYLTEILQMAPQTSLNQKINLFNLYPILKYKFIATQTVVDCLDLLSDHISDNQNEVLSLGKKGFDLLITSLKDRIRFLVECRSDAECISKNEDDIKKSLDILKLVFGIDKFDDLNDLNSKENLRDYIEQGGLSMIPPPSILKNISNYFYELFGYEVSSIEALQKELASLEFIPNQSKKELKKNEVRIRATALLINQISELSLGLRNANLTKTAPTVKAWRNYHKWKFFQKGYFSFLEYQYNQITSPLRQTIVDTEAANKREILILNTLRGHVFQWKDVRSLCDSKKKIIDAISNLYIKKLEKTKEYAKLDRWKKTGWGYLIIHQSDILGIWDSVKGIFSKDFQSEIHHIKFHIDTLDEQIKAIPETEIKERKKKERQKSEYLICLYQMFLNPIIDEIGRRQRMLIRQLDATSPFGMLVEHEVVILKDAYNYFITEHKSETNKSYDFLEQLRVGSGGLNWAIEGVQKILKSEFDSYGETTGIYTLGDQLFFQKVPSQEIENKMRYAELGYSLLDALEIFPSFNSLKWDSNDIPMIVSHFKKTLSEFFVWADTHPEAAANLTDDIYHTVLLFNDDNLINRFHLLLNRRAYVNAFLYHLGNATEEKPVESLDMLKYRALADFFRMIPVPMSLLISAKKNVGSLCEDLADGRWISAPVKFIGNLVKDGVSTSVMQQASAAIGRNAGLVNDMISVAKGESFASILENRRILSMIELSTEIRAAYMTPKTWFAALTREASIWVKVMVSAYQDSQYTELMVRAVVQIGFPLAVAAAACGVCVAIISASTGLWIFVPIAGIPVLAGYAREGFRIVNDSYKDTRKKVEKEELDDENFRKRLEKDHFKKGSHTKVKIEAQAKKLIEEAKQFNTITEVPLVTQDELNVECQKYVKELSLEINKQLGGKLVEKIENGAITAKDYIVIFGNVAKVKNIHETLLKIMMKSKKDGKLSSEAYKNINEKARKICFAVIGKLEQKWLKSMLEQALFEELSGNVVKHDDVDAKTIIHQSIKKEDLEVVNAKDLADVVLQYFKRQLKNNKKALFETDQDIDMVIDAWSKMKPR